MKAIRKVLERLGVVLFLMGLMGIIVGTNSEAAPIVGAIGAALFIGAPLFPPEEK